MLVVHAYKLVDSNLEHIALILLRQKQLEVQKQWMDGWTKNLDE